MRPDLHARLPPGDSHRCCKRCASIICKCHQRDHRPDGRRWLRSCTQRHLQSSSRAGDSWSFRRFRVHWVTSGNSIGPSHPNSHLCGFLVLVEASTPEGRCLERALVCRTRLATRKAFHSTFHSGDCRRSHSKSWNGLTHDARNFDWKRDLSLPLGTFQFGDSVLPCRAVPRRAVLASCSADAGPQSRHTQCARCLADGASFSNAPLQRSQRNERR